ncbi:hypothetical protein SETIT_9G381500v2 [Setaria italica]|uniref:Uncharacterized protein n=1 Tax=Setaria italica TaxID=4555 RepID=A0A368SQ22_SETIT|nr:hypothetical protein SETIT_9G381500v2 [Setaria italica]
MAIIFIGAQLLLVLGLSFWAFMHLQPDQNRFKQLQYWVHISRFKQKKKVRQKQNCGIRLKLIQHYVESVRASLDQVTDLHQCSDQQVPQMYFLHRFNKIE